MTSYALYQNDRNLLFSPDIAVTLGRPAALFLQQLHYYMEHEHLGTTINGTRWIYNTYEGWASELKAYSRATVERCVSKLKKLGVLLVEHLNPYRSVRTNYYSINYQKLEELLQCPLKAKKEQKQAKAVKNHPLKMRDPSPQNEEMLYHRKHSQNVSDGSECFSISNKSDNADALSDKSIEKAPSSSSSQNCSSDGVVDQQPKEPLAASLMNIWNEEVGKHHGRVLRLTRERSRSLVAALKVKFGGSTDKWRDLCGRVAKSNFLMGRVSDFVVQLDWLLKFKTLEKIEEGCYGVCPSEMTMGTIEESVIQEDDHFSVWLSSLEEWRSSGRPPIDGKVLTDTEWGNLKWKELGYSDNGLTRL